MKIYIKLAFYAFVLCMTSSCTGISSSTSTETSTEILDSIPIYSINTKMETIEVYDMGNLPAGDEVRDAVAIYNFDSERGARIESINGDDLVSKCNPSLDSIEPRMIISVDYRLKVPEKKGPFDATMNIHYKNVKNPSIIKIHGNAE